MTLQATLRGIAACICVLTLSFCSPPLIYKSIWQGIPVTVDGKAAEWQLPLAFYDSKTKLSFTISNDMANLYVCVRVVDDRTQAGIMRTGLQVWIDTTGKKNRHVGLQFPMLQKEEGTLPGHTPTQRDGQESSTGNENTNNSYQEMPDTGKINRMRRGFTSHPKEMRVTGFINVPDGLLELPSIYTINTSIGWDNSGAMIYEASIPLNTIYKRPFTTSDTNRVLSLCFNVTVTPKLTGSVHGGGIHGGGGGMRGGMGGGMSGHGGGDKEGGSSQASPEQQTVLAIFRLAVK